jgi:hypothetical protein
LKIVEQSPDHSAQSLPPLSNAFVWLIPVVRGLQTQPEHSEKRQYRDNDYDQDYNAKRSDSGPLSE